MKKGPGNSRVRRFGDGRTFPRTKGRTWRENDGMGWCVERVGREPQPRTSDPISFWLDPRSSRGLAIVKRTEELGGHPFLLPLLFRLDPRKEASQWNSIQRKEMDPSPSEWNGTPIIPHRSPPMGWVLMGKRDSMIACVRIGFGSLLPSMTPFLLGGVKD